MECVMNYNRFFNPKIFYPIFILVCTTLFFSCENFLNGGDVKEAIDKAIYIANNECPVATLEEPVMQSGGVPKNSAIIITFTKSMNPETFDNNFYIEDSKGNSLKEYFIKAEWSNDNKYVKIAANEQKLIDLGKQDTMEIIVKLSKACTTPDELPITTAINHKYKINTEIDNKAPEITSVIAKVPGTYIPRKAEEGPLILKEGLLPVVEALATASEEQKKAENELLSVNHIKTKFDIYIEGNDYGGGKVRGHVNYHQLYDSMGEKVSADVEEFYVNLTKKEDSDNYSGTYTIDLSDKKYTDGLYEVKVTVQDSYNLDSKEVKTYNVIRDTIFAYSSKTRFGLSSPLFRDDFSEDVDESVKAQAIAEWWYDPSVMPPTAKKIEECIKEVSFSYLPSDAYYRSKTTGKTYCDVFKAYTYYLSWGLDINKLSTPMEFTAYDWIMENPDSTEYKGPILNDFETYVEAKKDKNIIIQAKILDSVGNDNYITILYPKQNDFQNYKVVSSGENSDKKNVELFFEDMTNSDFTKIANLPDRQVKAIYRVYYGKLEDSDPDDTNKQTVLKRNTAKPLEEDHWSDTSDLHIIKNLDPNSKYVVYVQVEYKTFSNLNGQWVGETYGPLRKVIVDTSLSGNAVTQAPVFTFTKKSSGINTGLFDITVNITNFDNTLKYVPCYSSDGGNNWVYYESSDEATFTFKVTNPLRAPFENEWNKQEWDKTYWTDEWGNERDNGDNSYFEAVKVCKEKYGYPAVPAKIKILASQKTESEVSVPFESVEQEISFSEADDNIPPFITNNITQHDSRLSYDGRYYQFENIVREDEGHLSEYYNYYYAPYQESWGENLSVMEPAEIEALPGGIATYTSSSFYSDGAAYNIDASIPVYGLPDGRYMFFAKVTDTYGNYAYITLGKADIGTFKNKLSVNYDPTKNMLISTLPIEGNEYFGRNMIHIQDCWHEDSKKATVWVRNGYYDYLNELQNCMRTTENGKTVLKNDNSITGLSDFISIDWDVSPAIVSSISPRALRGNTFYRITMQSFNENPYKKSTNKGVDRRYGRPYSNFDETHPYVNDQKYLYTDKIEGYVEGETEYDLCTEETVSNTVYYYLPTTADDGTLNETTFNKNYLNDIKSSFFADTATPRSNKAYLVNVIASGSDLGKDADEWERRGKLIKTHLYYEWRTQEEYDNFNTFNSSVAADDMYASPEKGLVYYVAVVHFADGKTALSKVYSMQGF